MSNGLNERIDSDGKVCRLALVDKIELLLSLVGALYYTPFTGTEEELLSNGRFRTIRKLPGEAFCCHIGQNLVGNTS